MKPSTSYNRNLSQAKEDLWFCCNSAMFSVTMVMLQFSNLLSLENHFLHLNNQQCMLRDYHFISCTLNMTRFRSMPQFFHHLQNIYEGLKRMWKLDNIISHALTQNPKQIQIIIAAKQINIFSKLQHFFFTHLACFATDPSLRFPTPSRQQVPFKIANSLYSVLYILSNCKSSHSF
jgi:hypothetical protein